MRTGPTLAVTTAAFLISALPALAQGRQGPAVQLPEGPGKELVQATCSRCHGLNFVTDSWDTRGRLGTSRQLDGPPCDGPGPCGLGYLAKNFPVKPRRRQS